MAILRVEKGPLAGTEFPVFSTREPTVIGRDPGVEVYLEDQRASRRHATIVLDHGRWLVRDLDSSNGTLLAGRRIGEAPLENGAVLGIGSHQLAFHEREIATPPARRLQGTRLLEAVREQAGAFVCRGYQSAMDREVRADWLHPRRCRADPSFVAELSQAIEEARSLSDGLVPVLRGEVAPAPDGDGPAADPEGARGAWVILGGAVQPDLATELTRVLALAFAERVALFAQIVERILERASRPRLAYPVGLASLGVRLEAGRAPQLTVPAFDLGAYLAGATGDALHLASVAPYLAPEHREGPPADRSAALTYNLGALGRHLLTGQPPAAAASHATRDDLPLELATLLERMVATDPALRPTGDGLLERIRRLTPEAIACRPPDVAPSALEDDDILAELERPPRPAAGSARPHQRPRPTRPARPISRRRRAARRSSLLHLPLWILVWVGLFFAARYLSKVAFRELGL